MLQPLQIKVHNLEMNVKCPLSNNKCVCLSHFFEQATNKIKLFAFTKKNESY